MQNIKSLFSLALICFSLLSCTKEFNKPIINSGGFVAPEPEKAVVYSNWFSAYWEGYGPILQFMKVAPELNVDGLNSKILVYGKGGLEMRGETALPTTFDRNYIFANKDIASIKFILQGSGSISSSLQFRYILIPSNKIAVGESLNYNDYHAVCDYYQIPE